MQQMWILIKCKHNNPADFKLMKRCQFAAPDAVWFWEELEQLEDPALFYCVCT